MLFEGPIPGKWGQPGTTYKVGASFQGDTDTPFLLLNKIPRLKIRVPKFLKKDVHIRSTT